MAGRNLAALVSGGEGGQREGLEEVESYLLVALDEVGGFGEEGRRRGTGAAAAVLGGGGVPVKGSRQGRAGELHGG